MPLHLVLFVLFIIMAYRIASASRRDAAILSEFKLRSTLPLAVLLFPLGPLMLLGLGWFLPFPMPAVLASACYVPALLIASHNGQLLDTAGTDRVQAAQANITHAFGTALIGLTYTAACFFLGLW